MKNGLLSIGEFAKLRGINVKSLRYYESIGALLPAYVSPESGYRYYSINQLSDLDVVLTLIELGIPLKTIAHYAGHGTQQAAGGDASADGTAAGGTAPNALELLEQGKRLAQQRIERAQAQLIQLEDYANEMAQQAKHAESDVSYQRPIAQRLALCAPLQAPFSMKSYATATDELYRFAPSVGLVPLYTQGVLHDPARTLECVPSIDAVQGNTGTQRSTLFAFLQAHPLPHTEYHPADYESVLAGAGIFLATLPEATYSCTKITAPNFDECFDAGLAHIRENSTLTVLAEAWSVSLGPTKFVLEAQRIL